MLLKATTVTMLFLKTCGHCDASASVCVICGGLCWAVAVSAAAPVGSAFTRPSHDCYRLPVSCIPIPTFVLTPSIQGKSRVRNSARTDLYGGRSAMTVPTVTGTGTFSGVSEYSHSIRKEVSFPW